MTDTEALWADRLDEGRFRLADGLDAERLARRYDVDGSEAIAELTNRATLELLNSEYRTLSLEEFDSAAKRMDVEIREVMTDGGSASVGADRCWDHENCPRDDCDGELQQQDKFNVMCLSCEEVWAHVKTDTKHYLQTADFETVAEKSVAMADGGTDHAPPILYLGQEDEATSPRTLVQYAIYEPGSDDVDHYAWEATQPNGVVDDGKGYERDVIGFAEFPRNQPVGRFTDPEEFAEFVEAKSVYVHWKPAADAIDVTGAPFDGGAQADE